MTENPVESKSADTSSSPGNADAVVNLDGIIHKNVRTLDNQGIGKVIAVPNDEDTIIISSQSGGEQYKIPKSSVSGFNGAEVYLTKLLTKYLLPIKLRMQEYMKQNPVTLLLKSILISKKKKKPPFHL
jgi:hypothetical protein